MDRLAEAGGEDARAVLVDGARLDVVEQTIVDASRRRMTVTTTWPGVQTVLSTRLVSDRTWRRRLARTGWKTLTVSSDFRGSPANSDDPKRVYVARLKG